MNMLETCWNWMMSLGWLGMFLGMALFVVLIVLIVVLIARALVGQQRPR